MYYLEYYRFCMCIFVLLLLFFWYFVLPFGENWLFICLFFVISLIHYFYSYNVIFCLFIHRSIYLFIHFYIYWWVGSKNYFSSFPCIWKRINPYLKKLCQLHVSTSSLLRLWNDVVYVRIQVIHLPKFLLRLLITKWHGAFLRPSHILS